MVDYDLIPCDYSYCISYDKSYQHSYTDGQINLCDDYNQFEPIYFIAGCYLPVAHGRFQVMAILPLTGKSILIPVSDVILCQPHHQWILALGTI